MCSSKTLAQEGLRPLSANLNYVYKDLANESHNRIHSKNLYSNKTATASLLLPFKDDFFYSTHSVYASPNLWKDSSAYINSGFGIAPPSIGVATFDGLNKYGYPYTPFLTNFNQSLPADTLTSQPINLFVTATSQTLQISDSIALTFYYQAKGRGDAPELSDSLILDFYKPIEKIWKSSVWAKGGNVNANTNDTVFKRGFVWVNDTAYLHEGFQFRFRNKAATAGDFDHWHIDYVYLDKNRHQLSDTVYDDLTFAYVPSSYLTNYSAMPWQQFNITEIAAKNTVKIKNNSGVAINHTYESILFDKTKTNLGTYQGGPTNLCPFKPSGCTTGTAASFGYSSYAPHANPAINYTFAALNDSADFVIQHSVGLTGSSVDFIKENDTIIQYQRFRNYYAFDDGSAEGGYFINGVGGLMAEKIKVNALDTLQAIRIYFDPVGEIILAQESYNFKVLIWDAGANGPGNLIYTSGIMTPKYYNTGFREMPEYKLNGDITLRTLKPSTYYIGIQQQVATGITIGFDKNYDHHTSLYFNSGGGWEQSKIYGSLMIRPVFGKVIPAPLSIEEPTILKKQDSFSVFPNPATDQFIIKNKNQANSSFSIYNSVGQKILEEKITSEEQVVNVSQFNSGVYFIIVKENNADIKTQRIIIQH